MWTEYRSALPAFAFLPTGTFSARVDLCRSGDGVGTASVVDRDTLSAQWISAVWAHCTLWNCALNARSVFSELSNSRSSRPDHSVPKVIEVLPRCVSDLLGIDRSCTHGNARKGTCRVELEMTMCVPMNIHLTCRMVCLLGIGSAMKCIWDFPFPLADCIVVYHQSRPGHRRSSGYTDWRPLQLRRTYLGEQLQERRSTFDSVRTTPGNLFVHAGALPMNSSDLGRPHSSFNPEAILM